MEFVLILLTEVILVVFEAGRSELLHIRFVDSLQETIALVKVDEISDVFIERHVGAEHVLHVLG